MRTTPTLDDDVLASAELARRGLAPAQPAVTRNGTRLFPVRPDAGPVTPELVKKLAEDID